MKIKLIGSLYQARVDKEGSWRVTFEVPASHGVEVAKLSAMTEQAFEINIEPEKRKPVKPCDISEEIPDLNFDN